MNTVLQHTFSEHLLGSRSLLDTRDRELLGQDRPQTCKLTITAWVEEQV